MVVQRRLGRGRTVARPGACARAHRGVLRLGLWRLGLWRVGLWAPGPVRLGLCRLSAVPVEQPLALLWVRGRVDGGEGHPEGAVEHGPAG